VGVEVGVVVAVVVEEVGVVGRNMDGNRAVVCAGDRVRTQEEEPVRSFEGSSW